MREEESRLREVEQRLESIEASKRDVEAKWIEAQQTIASLEVQAWSYTEKISALEQKNAEE